MTRMNMLQPAFILCMLLTGNLHAETTLPLRTDSVIGLADILRIALTLLLLLAVTYALLWLYQRHYGKLPPGFSSRQADLSVVSKLRLSARTQVFVLRHGTQEFLVTESARGATTLAITPFSSIVPPAEVASSADYPT